MNKLNLQLVSIKEMLTKEQMKKITGGYSRCSSGSCTIDVPGHTGAAGKCEENTNKQCICKALDYPASAPDSNYKN